MPPSWLGMVRAQLHALVTQLHPHLHATSSIMLAHSFRMPTDVAGRTVTGAVQHIVVRTPLAHNIGARRAV